MIWIILAAILLVYKPIWFAAIALMAITVLVVSAIEDSKQTQNVQYAVVVGRTKVMTTKSRPSGYSISSRGNVRGYWRFREEVDHIEIEFEVHYEDGRVRHVKATEGTGKCNRLLSFVGKEPKPEPPKPKAVEPPKFVEVPKPIEPLKIEQKNEPPKRKNGKYFIDIPFEIAPNEYGLTVSYPSCQIEKRNDGESRIHVRFTVSYDPTVKGVRNRVAICSAVDQAGRTMEVRKGSKVFDTSGSQMVDILFWENADEEPAKIVVGIDRYY